MPPREYETFDLLIERNGDRFRARVLSSPAGNAADDLPGATPDEYLWEFLSTIGRPRRARGGPSVSVTAETERFGDRLFAFLFPGPIAACLERSRSSAIDKGHGLRIQIRLSDVPELCDLPWELLHDKEFGFFGLTTDTSIVRFLELKQPLSPLNVTPPLRILALISSPSNSPQLDVEREWANLQQAVSGLKANGLVDMQRLDDPQLPKLNQRLRASPFHILHFIGHGFFDEQLNAGQLYFQDPVGRAQPVSGEQLAAALRDHKSLRLVVLNACEGARSSLADPFAGVAQALIRRGLPAVIAMQFEITDAAAVTFASEFYALIAFGDPIDACVAGARKAIYFSPNEVEWATPVLYLRSAGGELFTVEQTQSVVDQRAQHSSIATESEQFVQQFLESKLIDKSIKSLVLRWRGVLIGLGATLIPTSILYLYVALNSVSTPYTRLTYSSIAVPAAPGETMLSPVAPPARAAPRAPPTETAAAKQSGETIAVGPPPKIATNDPGGEVFKECEHCPEMVVVPAGEATLGSPLGEGGRQRFEVEPHEVDISRPFAVGRYVVTFAQWDACFAEGGCANPHLGDLAFRLGDHPVIFATWKEAQQYVEWLQRKTGGPYRLLSEAEWEYAARGCRDLKCPFSPFWFGTIKPELAVYDSQFSYNGSPIAEPLRKTAPVNSGHANPFGLYNMLGNVRQWTQDCWNATLAATPSNGAPVLSGDCTQAATRGGSWADPPSKLRASARNYWSVDEGSENIGFRVARDLAP